MNCDEAFEAMTSPALADSQELRWHLDLCPRCREMREVLQPALSLFSDPAPRFPDDADLVQTQRRPAANVSTETAQQAFLSPEALILAENTARSLTPRRKFRRTWVAVVAGLMLAFGVGWFSGLSGSSQPVKSGGLAVESGLESERCLWMVASNPTDTAVSPRPTGVRSIVLSCVSCHISPE